LKYFHPHSSKTRVTPTFQVEDILGVTTDCSEIRSQILKVRFKRDLSCGALGLWGQKADRFHLLLLHDLLKRRWATRLSVVFSGTSSMLPHSWMRYLPGQDREIWGFAVLCAFGPKDGENHGV